MRHSGWSRILWFALAGLVLLLLGADTLYWRFATRQLDAGFRDWVTAQQAAGWTVRTSPPRIGGWPLAATLTATDVDLSGGALDFPGGMHWQAERLTLRVDLLHPQQLQAIPGGMQHLRLGDGPNIPFTARRMRADVPLQPDAPPGVIILHARDLRAGVAPGGDAGTLAIAHLQARLDDQPQGAEKPALGFAVDATSLSLPPEYRWALGHDIASLRLDGTLLGPFPLARDLAARAAGWRNGGGALVLRTTDLQWGPLGLSGNARLGLDQQLQPAGHATAQVTGYDATLDALAKAGAMSPPAALAAKALLSLMAEPAAKGVPARVDVPLRIRHSTLLMRDVPLLRLPVLDWPQS